MPESRNPASGNVHSRVLQPTLPKLRSRAASVLVAISVPNNANIGELEQFLTSHLSARLPRLILKRIVKAGLELLDGALRYGAVSAEPFFEIAVDDSKIEVRVGGSASPGRVEIFRERIKPHGRDPSGSATAVGKNVSALHGLVSDPTFEVSYEVASGRLVLRAVAHL